MTEHTQGPWSYCDDFSEVQCEGGFLTVAKVLPIAEEGDERANGRLMAAAPDLLAACRLALQDLETWHGECGAYQGDDGGMRYSSCDGCCTCQETLPALQAAIRAAGSRHGHDG